MALSPQEIAARLPELTGGPHDDDTITALAAITAETVRVLNHATFSRAAISEPATVNRVLAELAAATDRLPQLFAQLALWLAKQAAAGQLAHDRGDLTGALAIALPSLDQQASHHAAELGAALDRAQQATAGLYRAEPPDQGGEPR